MDERPQFEPTVLGAMWRYRWLVAGIVVGFAALGMIYAILSPARFQATANLVVEDPRSSALFDIGNAQNPQRYVSDQAAILGSALVAERAAADESTLESANEVLEGLEVFWNGGSNLVQASFTADTEKKAVAGANAVTSAYEAIRQDSSSTAFDAALSELDETINAVDDQLDRLRSQIESEVAGDPSSEALNRQLSEALARLVSLQSALPNASEETLPQLRGELDDVLQQLNTLQTVSNLEAQRPEMAALLEEERQTIVRKAGLLQRQDQINVDARLASTGITLADPALFAVEVGADAKRTTAVGIMLGLLIAAAVTYFLALRNRTFSERSQPEIVLGVPLLAEVPDFRAERITGETPVRSNPASVAAEAFRFVSTSIDVESEQQSAEHSPVAHFADEGPGSVKTFAIISSTLSEGKTVVAANTALALARQGKRVLAIDTDFGNQRLSEILSVDEPTQGLTDFVDRDIPLSDVLNRIPVAGGNSIDLVSRGTVRVTGPDFFRSAGVRTFFSSIKDEYDLIVIDTPPLQHVAYAASVVRFADRAIVVVRHNGNVNNAEELSDRLSMLDTEVIGYVYNKAPLREEMARAEGSLKDVLGKDLRLSARE